MKRRTWSSGHDGFEESDIGIDAVLEQCRILEDDLDPLEDHLVDKPRIKTRRPREQCWAFGSDEKKMSESVEKASSQILLD